MSFTLSQTCTAMNRMSLKASSSSHKSSTSTRSMETSKGLSMSFHKCVSNTNVFAFQKTVKPSQSNGRGALVITAGGRSIGCTLGGTRRKSARKSGFFARMQTPNGRRVLKARMKKGRKNLCPAGKTHSTWNRMKK